MRNDFMSKTVTSAEHKGLIAYLPTLPPQHIALPDEIALVVYQTKAAYMKLLKDTDWQKYATLHWKYFDSKLSKSLKTEPLSGAMKNEHAYDVLQSSANWQKGYAVCCISKKLKQPDAYVRAMKTNYSPRFLTSYLILTTQNYVIEYQLWASKNAYKKNLETVEKMRRPYLHPFIGACQPMQKTTIDRIEINYSEGINMQFHTTNSKLLRTSN